MHLPPHYDDDFGRATYTTGSAWEWGVSALVFAIAAQLAMVLAPPTVGTYKLATLPVVAAPQVCAMGVRDRCAR